MRPRWLLPVETQTVAFVEAARASDRPMQSQWLVWQGYRVYLRYARAYATLDDEALGEVLVIANIEVPGRFRRRGWFWRYCQLCLALVDNGLVIENVHNPYLYAALARHPQFRLSGKYDFVILKRHPGDWPLRVRST